ncbi:unnamed protein product [Orchesella dallaii]|uniref:CCHC-type domain-containing protein n=1 Tax=Orchesella dallaii TaxID=48710 RepID=A0ABP1PUD8_9HEXA
MPGTNSGMLLTDEGLEEQKCKVLWDLLLGAEPVQESRGRGRGGRGGGGGGGRSCFGCGKEGHTAHVIVLKVVVAEEAVPVSNAGKKATCLESAHLAEVVAVATVPVISVAKKATCPGNVHLEMVEEEAAGETGPVSSTARKDICPGNVHLAEVATVPVTSVACGEEGHMSRECPSGGGGGGWGSRGCFNC